MGTKLIVVTPGLVLLILVWTFFMIRSYSRTRHVPRCWRCGMHKVRRSQIRGFFDGLAALWGLRAFRCSGCRTRFYGLRLHSHTVQRST